MSPHWGGKEPELVREVERYRHLGVLSIESGRAEASDMNDFVRRFSYCHKKMKHNAVLEEQNVQ